MLHFGHLWCCQQTLALSRQWSWLRNGHFSRLCLFILYSLFLKDPFDEAERSVASCRQGNTPTSLFMAQWETFHNRPTWSHEYMWDGTQRAVSVYIQLTKTDKKTEGFPLMCLPLSEVRSLLFMLRQPKPSRPIPVKCRAEIKKIPTAGGLGPRSDQQWSPRRLHVPACSMGARQAQLFIAL